MPRSGNSLPASALVAVPEMQHLIIVLIRWAIDGEMPLTRCIVCAGRVGRALGGDGADLGAFRQACPAIFRTD